MSQLSEVNRPSSCRPTNRPTQSAVYRLAWRGLSEHFSQVLNTSCSKQVRTIFEKSRADFFYYLEMCRTRVTLPKTGQFCDRSDCSSSTFNQNLYIYPDTVLVLSVIKSCFLNGPHRQESAIWASSVGCAVHQTWFAPILYAVLL